MALVEQQLEQASNENIQRMRQSQIAAAKTEYARRIRELDSAMERAETIFEPVAYGVMEAKGNA